MTKRLIRLGIVFATVLSIFSVSGFAATRLYLQGGITNSTLTPGFDSGWTATTGAVRRYLAPTKGNDTVADGATINCGASANNSCLDRQYISPPLSGNQTISGTFKGYHSVRELATTDDIDRWPVSIRVLQSDGTTYRCTLLSLADYSPGINETSTTTINRIIADGDSLTSCSALDGDRLVVEVGYQVDASGGTTPQGVTKFGTSGTDCPEDETDTTNCTPWVEFSGTINFASDFVQGQYNVNGQPATTCTAASPNNVITGDMLIYSVDLVSATATAGTPTDTRGNTYTLIDGPTTNSTDRAYTWYTVSGSSGANTISTTLSASITANCYASEYSGIASGAGSCGGTTCDQHTSGTGTANPSSIGPVTTTAANERIYVFGLAEVGTFAAASGWTSRSTTSGNLVEDKRVTSASTYTGDGSGATRWSMHEATFKEATQPAGGSGTASPADTVTTSPAVAVSAGRPVAISDSATISPAVAVASGRSAAPSDTVTSSPAVNISAGRSAAPAVTVTTSPAVTVSTGRTAAQSESVTTSPAVAAALGRGAPMSETATTSPAVATQAAFNRTQADSVSSSPAVSVSAGRSAALAVTITTAPSLSVQSGKGAPVSDSFSLSPAVTAQAAHNAAMSDSVGSVPAVTLQVGRNQALAQSLTVAPALLVQAGKSLAISEAAAFGDAVATRLDRKRSIAEGITAADSLSVVVHVGGQRRRSVIIG